MVQLSVVVPCYNEARNIPALLERFANFKAQNFELVLVNNGSTDETSAVLKRELKKYRFARVVRIEKNIGYGYGIMTGLRDCKADIVAYTHADLQSDPADVFRAFEVYNKSGGNVLVKGVRIHRKISAALLARGLDIVALLSMKTFFYDINAQPKVFSRDFLNKLDNAPNGYYLDLYVVAKAKKSGIKIREIPVIFEKRLHGTSSWQKNFMARAKNIMRFFIACFEVRRSL